MGLLCDQYGKEMSCFFFFSLILILNRFQESKVLFTSPPEEVYSTPAECQRLRPRGVLHYQRYFKYRALDESYGS